MRLITQAGDAANNHSNSLQSFCWLTLRVFFPPISKKTAFLTKCCFHFFFFFLKQEPCSLCWKVCRLSEPHTRGPCDWTIAFLCFHSCCSSALWVLNEGLGPDSFGESGCQIWHPSAKLSLKFVPRTSIRMKNTCRRQQDSVRRKVRLFLKSRCYV